MKNNYSVDEIKKLIKEGFKPELISLELGIPLEEVKKHENELNENQANFERNEPSTKNEDVIVGKENEVRLVTKSIRGTKSRMEKMRQRYFELYNESNVKDEVERKLTNEEVELINSVIESVKNNVEGIDKFSKEKKRQCAINIMSELKKIETIPLTIEQAEMIIDLIDLKKLQRLGRNMHDYTDDNIKKAKNKIIKKLADSINIKQSQTDDLKELEELRKKLSSEIVKENYISAGTIKSRISDRISKIQQQHVFYKIRYDVPESIYTITKELVNGNINIEKANLIIEEEAKTRVTSKPKTRFSLNEEQEKNQIYIQIKTLIRERTDEFQVENPRVVMDNMQKFFGGNAYNNLNVVVDNLIARKEFEKAKGICNNFNTGKNDDNEEAKYIWNLKKKIRNAEIGDIVLRGIHMQGSKEDEEKYFEIIESGLKRGNVKPETILLGKSQDGLRTISLADIWKDEQNKGLLK